MSSPAPQARTAPKGGKLRIGDDWNAITIIALSQDNPLKAVAEFVENSIDAGAATVTITRGKERGEHFLEIADDGRGVPRDEDGVPDFRYVATHICDSVKRRLKTDGVRGIQGEFGIGLLSFWTVGEELAMSSAADDGRLYEMRMRKGDPGYAVSRKASLVAEPGTRLKIRPLLAGVRQLSGEKIQRYLASELRERIRQSGVRIRVVDRQARKELAVEPRQFTGELLHRLPPAVAPQGEVYVELYLDAPSSDGDVGLYRSGTRVLESLTRIEALRRSPWTEGSLQGIVDAPFLNLTPATRTGVVHDEALEALVAALEPVARHVAALIEERKRAEEERSSRDTLRAIQRAFREAMLALPSEEYEWFDVRERRGSAAADAAAPAAPDDADAVSMPEPGEQAPVQREFFHYAGPLFSVRIVPTSSTVAVEASRTLRALARDASRRHVTEDVEFEWRILEGAGRLEDAELEYATFHAPPEPGLSRLSVVARQGETVCEAQALVTVADTLLPEAKERLGAGHGLPGYTLEHAPGRLWRSRFDEGGSLIVVNSGHRDYVFAARAKSLKLRYLVRLYAKEMVKRNFPELRGDELLDRLVELSLYAEENL
jgi:hypothetical protein